MASRTRKTSSFQSHAGSIEAWIARRNAAILQLTFNPTLVRLRPAASTPGRTGSRSFQSHAGSIEALAFALLGTLHRLAFNPTLVRLRPRITAPL